jgi:hypothetical protein
MLCTSVYVTTVAATATAFSTILLQKYVCCCCCCCCCRLRCQRYGKTVTLSTLLTAVRYALLQCISIDTIQYRTALGALCHAVAQCSSFPSWALCYGIAVAHRLLISAVQLYIGADAIPLLLLLSLLLYTHRCASAASLLRCTRLRQW